MIKNIKIKNLEEKLKENLLNNNTDNCITVKPNDATNIIINTENISNEKILNNRYADAYPNIDNDEVKNILDIEEEIRRELEKKPWLKYPFGNDFINSVLSHSKKISEKLNDIEHNINNINNDDIEKEYNDKYEHVNHPNHYNNYDVEVIEMMRRIYGDEKTAIFCELNAFKYRMRMGTKPDNDIIQDLEKEKWYLNKKNELINNKQN